MHVLKLTSLTTSLKRYWNWFISPLQPLLGSHGKLKHLCKLQLNLNTVLWQRCHQSSITTRTPEVGAMTPSSPVAEPGQRRQGRLVTPSNLDGSCEMGGDTEPPGYTNDFPSLSWADFWLHSQLCLWSSTQWVEQRAAWSLYWSQS